MKRGPIFLSILILALALPAAAGVNSSIRVEAGEMVDKDLSTVNGKIRIGDGATVRGEAESVNGSIEIGRDVQVDSVSVVNGSIEIGEGTVIDGDVSTVNGRITMENGTRAREVATVNGSLKLSGVEVETDVSTYNGDVTLSGGTSVGGDIIIKDSKGNSHRDKPLRIYIEDGAHVRGNVIVENDDLEVEVYLRGGTVSGKLRGAKLKEK